MLSTPLICASIGAATESPTVFESAPGYVVVTVTCTGVMVGYCAIGSTDIDTSPATQMSNETTVANIGRSMKNLENMSRGPGYFFAAAGSAAFPGFSVGGFATSVPAGAFATYGV